MTPSNKTIVIVHGARTAFGHNSKSLAHVSPEVLMGVVMNNLVKKSGVPAALIDGVIIGWVAQGGKAPNLARVAALQAGLPETVQAVTTQSNCISGLEAICDAARHILLGEGEIFIAGGTESMSSIPFSIGGARSSKALRSLESLKTEWKTLLENPDIEVFDTLEAGLVDPLTRLNMAATAEVCAQMYDIPRAEQDKYAHESFRRCLEAEDAGFYSNHVIPVETEGTVLLEKDEYVYLRKNLVSKPEMFPKAPNLFDTSAYSIKDFYKRFGGFIHKKLFSEETRGTLTAFNSSAKSDGAAAVLIMTEDKAKELGLPILARIRSWATAGTSPSTMGISPIFASEKALGKAGINFKDLGQIELHEAFAATCLSVFKLGKEKFGQNWQERWEDKSLNPNGGSIPLGHPIAATGVRLILNLIFAMKNNPIAEFGLATACSGGGLGGAMILERAA